MYLQRRVVFNWFKKLKKEQPQVYIGANILKLNGVDFHIHAIHKNSNLSTTLVPPDAILKKISMDVFLRDYIQELQVPGTAVLHSHVYPKYILWCQEQRAKNNNLKWIHTYHLHYFKEHTGKDLLNWQKEFNRVFVEEASKADVKISVSKWQQKFYKEKFNIDTIYIPNGVDVAQCDKADAHYFQEKYHLSNYILNVSRHDPVKNPGEFVMLAKSMPEHNFVIIGSEFSELLFQEHYHIIPPKNLKIFGKMSQIEVQHAIAACRCLISTAKKEGLPTLVLEGMAHSKPVVVSNEPGSMEAIDNGAYGYFYELGNMEDLKGKTLLAINDNTIGSKARQRVLGEYDWKVVIKKLEKMYLENYETISKD
ncbi:glycosyltransferase family 4 protein [Paucihalobacter ruber]|uniref:Glycosyltransferase family 4 protein n=1 Tax=Paucihalobacter ruber TaxID=2567861 RepID=A0A506PPF1_9FLAO|nr:glycosyltransferase family 4 protein [Paucihalobacter ruber]TPV35756.1 glycosyltransferase family 4 protein [Paucihalobacter ruber]